MEHNINFDYGNEERFNRPNTKVEIDINGLLEKKKLRLIDVENKTGLSYQQLWNIKTGRTTKIGFDTIGKLLEAFKCKPNDLFKITK